MDVLRLPVGDLYRIYNILHPASLKVDEGCPKSCPLLGYRDDVLMTGYEHDDEDEERTGKNGPNKDRLTLRHPLSLQSAHNCQRHPL